jgi:hypothetical protein
MSFPKTLIAAAADNFPVLAAGDTVSDGGFLLTEDNINAIEQTLTNNETAVANLKIERDNASAALTAAQASQKNAEENAAALQKQVNTLTKERDDANALAAEYGVRTGMPAETDKDKDKEAKQKSNAKLSTDAYAESMGVPRV